MSRYLIVLSVLALAACHGKPERRSAREGRVSLEKPVAGNVHDRNACPPMVGGDWQTEEGQKLNVKDDGTTMTLTTSDDGKAHPVDGLVHTDDNVTTVASCSNGNLDYAYANGERKVHVRITTENILRGKMQTKTEYLNTTGAKVSSTLEREYTLSRPPSNS